jgi:hypothetical protein
MARYRSNRGSLVSNSAVRSVDTLVSDTSSGRGRQERSAEVGGAGSTDVYILLLGKSLCIAEDWSRNDTDTHWVPESAAEELKCVRPSSELSHWILAIAISHVSRTARLGSERYCSRIGREDAQDMAPIASAAYSTHQRYFGGKPNECTSWRTIGSSDSSLRTDVRTGRASGSLI